MKKILVFTLLVPFFISCKSDTYKVDKYFNKSEKDTLLANIITFIYVKPPYANTSNRFETQFRQYFVESLPKFSMENYFIDKDNTHYFFIIRPVGHTLKYRRGVLGKFKLKEGSLMPINFEEIINTPHLEEAVVKERGAFLFQELIKNGNLDKYLGMKHYIEWPDSSLVYDKTINEWVGRKATENR